MTREDFLKLKELYIKLNDEVYGRVGKELMNVGKRFLYVSFEKNSDKINVATLDMESDCFEWVDYDLDFINKKKHDFVIKEWKTN